MNCRRVNNLLSAFIDAELTGEEMLAVREHLLMCAGCQAEQEALLQTKRLLATLAIRTPRAELEGLLLNEVEREAKRPLRWLPGLKAPEFLRDWAFAWENALAGNDTTVRVNPALATVALSVAGLWLAATGLERGQERTGHFPDVIVFQKTPVFARYASRGESSASPIAQAGYGVGLSIGPATHAPMTELVPLTPDYTDSLPVRPVSNTDYALAGMGSGIPYRAVSRSFGASFFSVQ